jgi:hypothetical protein
MVIQTNRQHKTHTEQYNTKTQHNMKWTPPYENKHKIYVSLIKYVKIIICKITLKFTLEIVEIVIFSEIFP